MTVGTTTRRRSKKKGEPYGVLCVESNGTQRTVVRIVEFNKSEASCFPDLVIHRYVETFDITKGYHR